MHSRFLLGNWDAVNERLTVPFNVSGYGLMVILFDGSFLTIYKS